MTKILYVEDNEDTAEAVKIMLETAEFDVGWASCGKDALHAAKNKQYDLCLLDIMLPDMSGWDIFEKLKRSNYQAKYIFLSALPISQERLEQLQQAGVSDYITKPFKRADLIRRINAVIQR